MLISLSHADSARLSKLASLVDEHPDDIVARALGAYLDGEGQLAELKVPMSNQLASRIRAEAERRQVPVNTLMVEMMATAVKQSRSGGDTEEVGKGSEPELVAA